MAVLEIITGESSPVLRAKTQKVGKVTKDVKKLIRDMKKTVKGKGVGLAGPQVGVSLRLCLTQIHGKMVALIDPEIIWKSGDIAIDEEGCLSLPGIWRKVPRAKEIHLRYRDEKDQEQELKLSDFDARVVQHEIDHLDGILIIDYDSSSK